MAVVISLNNIFIQTVVEVAIVIMRLIYSCCLLLALSASTIGCKKDSNSNSQAQATAPDTSTIIRPSNVRFKDQMKQVVFWRRGNSTIPWATYDFTYTADGKISKIFSKESGWYCTFDYLYGRVVIRTTVNTPTDIAVDTFYFNQYGYPIRVGNANPLRQQWVYDGETPVYAISFLPDHYSAGGSFFPAHLDTLQFGYSTDGDPLSLYKVYDVSKPVQAADMAVIASICNGDFPLLVRHSYVFDTAGVDTLWRNIYTYDNQGRIISITAKGTGNVKSIGYRISY